MSQGEFNTSSSGAERMPPDSRAREIAGAMMHDLAIALYTRYEQLGNVQDLENVILCHRYAIRRLCPPGHPDHSSFLINLAAALRARYQRFGMSKDLEGAISLFRDALRLCPPRHPHRYMTINNLAGGLMTRHDKSGNVDDLQSSISLLRDALRICPPGHPDRSTSLNILAAALSTRYFKLGDANDLEDSIPLHREALILSPHGHPCRSLSLNNLAIAVGNRYDILGNGDDLEDCISLHREALSLSSPDHPDHSMSLNDLASALMTRYDKLGNSDDLEEGISLHREAFNLRPSVHPHHSMSLNNLANALMTRYTKMGNVDDLEASISLHREALSLRPPGHPYRYISLNNFSKCLMIRYERLDNVHDLEAGISLRREVLTLCPPGHPHFSLSLVRLGESLISRYTKLGNTDDFLQAFLLFEQAAGDSTADLYYRIRASMQWVHFAHSYDHETIFPAYTTLLELVNRSLIFRPNVELQQRFLATADIPKSVALDAASVAISARKLELAVEFLEQGRALLWSRVDAYKHPLRELRLAKGGDELADRLQAVSAKLEHLSMVYSTSTGWSETLNHESLKKAAILDNEMKEHRILSEEWEVLVGKVREIEGFGSFLRAAPFHTLRSAAAEGPVILVNISQYRSDAIILLKDTAPQLVSLLEVMLSELRDHKCRSARQISDTLAYLWDNIVSPIVDQLKDLGIPKRSRIWWCPTAELCALPLHAAGRGKNNLQNIHVSSYTSTLSSLIRARSNKHQPPAITKLLVVGQPSTDLKRVQDEVDIIRNLRPDVDVLFGPSEANREAVLEGLKDHSWVHFACHGLLGDEGQPFHASFKLHEDPKRRLLLLDLIRARLPNAELAFLSACHSAAGGLSTPDESIHLSAALQFCGFKSVVGTLWEMDDEDGPTISEKFYEYMFRDTDKIDFRDSAYALNSAIKEMRKAKVPMHRLAMFVHIGA